jgi:hypothetical protein
MASMSFISIHPFRRLLRASLRSPCAIADRTTKRSAVRASLDIDDAVVLIAPSPTSAPAKITRTCCALHAK